MFKIGDKVVPHQKTKGILRELDSSYEWQEAQSRGQSYLYVIEKIEEDALLLSSSFEEENDIDGDYFHINDVTLYDPWTVRFLNTEEKLTGYANEVEWVEEHIQEKKDQGTIGLAKFKKSHVSVNDGFSYLVGIYEYNARAWAGKNYMRFLDINKKNEFVYTSHSLDILLEFIKEMKTSVL